MSKFFKLVQNEYVKLFSKVSTWILCVLALLIFLIFPLLMYINEKISYNYVDMPGYDYKYQWELEDAKAKGNQLDVEKYTYLIDNDIPEGHWKHYTVNQLYALKRQAQTGQGDLSEINQLISRLETMLSQNDWRAYYNMIIEEAQKGLPYDPTLQFHIDEANYRLANGVPEDPEDDKSLIITKLYTSKAALEAKKSSQRPDPEEIQKLEEQVLKYQYMLDHNIIIRVLEDGEGVAATSSLWATLSFIPQLIIVLAFVIAILASVIITSEFAKGTIKLLLPNPVKRSKIFLSKYFAILSLAFILIVLAYIISVLSSIVFFGAKDIGMVSLSVVGGKVTAVLGLVSLAGKFALSSLSIFVIGTMAFMLSSLLRNLALSVSLSLLSLLSGSGIVAFLKEVIGADWARYILFANTDRIIFGTSNFFDHTLTFAIGAVVVHMVVFFLIAWDAFMRKDIR